MRVRKIRRTLEVLIAGIVVISAAFILSGTSSAPSPAPAVQNTGLPPRMETVSLTVQGIYSVNKVAISKDETVLGVLESLNESDPRLKLATKEYSGLGTLVESMGGINNGTGGKYWQYKVNGVMPQIGAGQYKLKDGDFIYWFFGKSEF